MSRRNYSNNKENRRKKSKAKKWIMIVCAFLAGLFVMGAVSSITAEKDLNPNNLLVKKETYVANLLAETAGGLSINWKDDGRFILSGKHSDDNEANNALYRYEFASVELEAGTYTLSHGNDDAASDTFHLYIQWDGEIKENVYKDAKTFTLDTDTTVIIGFAVKNNYFIFYEEIAPVLVSGTTAGEFYVEKK